MVKIPILVFDLDETIWFRQLLKNNKCRITLFPEIRTILDELAGKYLMAVASFNLSATMLLNKFNLLQYFDYVITKKPSYDGKDDLLEKIASTFNVNINNIILFDDNIINIVYALKLGTIAIHINNGLKRENIMSGIVRHNQISCV